MGDASDNGIAATKKLTPPNLPLSGEELKASPLTRGD